jgi:nucleoside-diphosphate-sugar epimerase
MRVLVAGATGVVGRQLLPVLSGAEHEVIGLVRSAEARAEVERLGARAIAGDALDREAVRRAVAEAAPEAIVNLLTAIPRSINPKRLARDFSQTNRLRTEGTANLLSAAAETGGVRRLIAQGLAYAYDPGVGDPAAEGEPLWSDPPAQFGPVLAALRGLEQQTTDAGGLVLRLGHLYGPGSIYAEDGSFVQAVRKGKIPLVGEGASVFSFTHAADVATAVGAALEIDVTGALNIVDDEPTPMNEWLPYLAEMLDAPRPRKAPAWIARMLVGGWGVAFMTRLRGADNTRAKNVLAWRPAYASWRTGFQQELEGSSG